jgi:diguanylate cyclase (GGDEF)-like protein
MDSSIDWLADASLTPEQRHSWNTLRSELSNARAVIADMEQKISQLERVGSVEEDHAILTRPDFNREVARMLAFDERYGGTSSVLYFDFDNLDEITAKFGKSVTNATIREISSILMKHIRGSDIIGRLAPDEFGVLLVRCENVPAWKKAEQLAAVLRDKLGEVHGHKLDVAISYGAYTFRENEDVTTGLKQAAEKLTRSGT